MTPFEEYKPKKKPKPELRVELNMDGRFCLNQTAYEDHFKDYSQVIFYFDRDKGKIGIKPVKHPTKNDYSFKLSADTGGHFALIYAHRFLEFYQIKYKTYIRSYVAEWNDKEELLEFTLEPARLQNVKRTDKYKYRYKP